MSKNLKYGSILLIFSLLIVRFFYIQIYYTFAISKGVSPVSYSIEESRDRGTLIKELTPSPRSISYDNYHDIFIKEVWLEYAAKSKNRLFWISKITIKDSIYVNLIYAFKNKTSGNLDENLYGADIIFYQYNEGEQGGGYPGLNLLIDDYQGELQKEYKYILKVEGKKGNSILLK